jgi:hypothetical protein
MEGEINRDFALNTLPELLHRLSTRYEVLRFVEFYDTRHVHDVKMIMVNDAVDQLNSESVAGGIQRLIQEVNSALAEHHMYNFLEKLRQYLTFDYLFRLEEIGVDIQVIPMQQSRLLQEIIKSIVTVLGESSSQNYALLVLDSIQQTLPSDESYIPLFSVDRTRYSEGLNALSISSDIDSCAVSDIGRSLQTLIEHIIVTLGESSGKQFLERLQQHLGKAYILRMEKMGVNLHIIQIKQNMLW